MKKITIGAILLMVFAMPIFPQQAQLTQATVVRVIDGDTIELAGGEHVRLIGVDAPELGRPGANEAAQFVRERVEGRTVWLEADGNDRDRHGRLRSYVWLQQPANPRDENLIRQHQLNALLLANGLASVMIIGNVRNEALFRQLASAASPEVAQGHFVGNRNSQIFHAYTCASVPGRQNRIYFETRYDAIRAGHRACQRCRP